MQYTKLGNTTLEVSRVCLGTMTFGEQNTEAEAHAQLDYALDQGVNFIDTAEMYPVPPRAETQGITEQYIGSWLAKRRDRDRLVIASKVAGPGELSRKRQGIALGREQIETALHDSLKRLQTDYLDLYQLHWPARSTNFFGKRGYQASDDSDATPIEETLESLNRVLAQGKVRHIGLSNETPWGAMRFLTLARQHEWPAIVSIQNPYSLLNRTFEIGLAEIADREYAGLLAYSPLGFGVLSGKYRDGRRPAGARLTLFERFSRYTNPQAAAATERYAALAERMGLKPAELALAYVNSRPFVTSNIIGATSLQQLEEDIGSINIVLNEEALAEIEQLHAEHPNPCP